MSASFASAETEGNGFIRSIPNHFVRFPSGCAIMRHSGRRNLPPLANTWTGARHKNDRPLRKGEIKNKCHSKLISHNQFTPMNQTIIIEKTYPYTPEEVWDALTNIDQLDEWLMQSNFKPLVGHSFQFHYSMDGKSGSLDCKVLEVKRPHRLSYT